MSKLRTHKSRKSIDRLIKESKDRDEAQIKAGTHEWIYNEKTRISTLKKCTQKKK